LVGSRVAKYKVNRQKAARIPLTAILLAGLCSAALNQITSETFAAAIGTIEAGAKLTEISVLLVASLPGCSLIMVGSTVHVVPYSHIFRISRTHPQSGLNLFKGLLVPSFVQGNQPA